MVHIRNATEDDIGQFKKVIESSILELCKGHYNSEQITALIDQYPGADLYAKWLNERFLIVAEDKKNVAGFAQFNPSIASIEAVHASRNFARRGIGRKLLSTIEDIAMDQGVHKITLSASLNSLEFYSSCGYVRKEPHTYRCKNGIELKTVIYEKIINR